MARPGRHSYAQLRVSLADADSGVMLRLGTIVLNVKDDWTYPAGARFVVLADPEGNLFCVINVGG
jgi:predicted enzyme related to lactoylglutathione lyase